MTWGFEAEPTPMSTPTNVVDPTLLPPAGHDGIPTRRTARENVAVRALAVAAVLAGVAYIAWRATSTLDGDALWLSVGFLVVETYGVASLALYVVSLWDADGPEPAAPVADTDLRVAVLVTTFNEPIEVLLPTVAAAVALAPAHETWVLDDGDRAEVAEMAAGLGARYLARADRRHAKAGNVNNAIEHVDADVVAILDADHVPQPGFLTNTLGYFDDPRMAVVQTPQEFYNRTSFEHGGGGFNEERVFYRVIAPAKNRWDAAFWCGTNALVRVEALRSVGGVATETITEDIHTTIRLHRAGWRTRYHNEVLAHGLAAGTVQEYLSQRIRWGTGAMQVLRLEKPLRDRGLTVPQRLAYATTLLGWFEAWRVLALALLPFLMLVTGQMPIAAPAAIFVPVFGAVYALQALTLSKLSRGEVKFGIGMVFEFCRMPASIAATLTLLRRGTPSFSVTNKGRSGVERDRNRAPRLLVGILVANAVGAAWFMLTLSGLTPTQYQSSGAAAAAFGWLLFVSVFAVAAIARATSKRFGAERRNAVRFDVLVEGRLDGTRCTVSDLSVGGARAELGMADAMALEPPTRLHLDVAGGIDLAVEIRTTSFTDDGLAILGLRVSDGQWPARAALARLLLARADEDGAVVVGGSNEADPTVGSALGRVGRRQSIPIT